MKARDDALIAGVAACAAVATAVGATRAAERGGAANYVDMLYPIMADGLAVLAYRKTRELAGWPRVVAWFFVLAGVGASGGAQAFTHAEGKHGGAAVLAAGVGAFPALAVIAAAVLGSLRARGAGTRAGTADDQAVSGVPAPPAEPVEEMPAPVPAPGPEEVPAPSWEQHRPASWVPVAPPPAPAAAEVPAPSRPRPRRRGAVAGAGPRKAAAVPDPVRDYWAEQLAAGVRPTGTDLAAVAGVSPTRGKQYRRTLEAETDAGNVTALTAAGRG